MRYIFKKLIMSKKNYLYKYAVLDIYIAIFCDSALS